MLPTKRTTALVVLCLLGLVSGWFAFAENGAGEEDPLSFTRAVRRAPSRMEDLPQNASTRRLLEQFKPRVHVAPGSYVPISFYGDYLPNTVLVHEQRGVVRRNVTREVLINHRWDTDVYLDYQRSISEARARSLDTVQPTLYGRVYADTLAHRGESVPLLFLKYSPVFPYSGLPDGNPWWKNLGGRVAGEPWGWHELDIHGAIHVILHARTRRPMGILLAQHNHHRTLLRGLDMAWPEEDRINISFAVRSNEPYLVSERYGSRLEPTVGNPFDVQALFGRSWVRPLSAGYDRVVAPADGARAVRTRLKLLPVDDPLYTSTMDLGDRRKLFGLLDSWFREGPPGIDYYTHPALKNLADLTAFWDIDPRDDRFFALLEEHRPGDLHSDLSPILNHQKDRLLSRLARLGSDTQPDRASGPD